MMMISPLELSTASYGDNSWWDGAAMLRRFRSQ